MKKIICLLMIFVLTGCGAKYQINITDNKIEENINISIIPNSNSSEDLVEMDVNSLDFINYIDKMDIKVLENGSSAIYDKLVTSDNGVYNINLKHKEQVLDAIRYHSDGFDSDNIMQLALILADKLDIKKTRPTKRGLEVPGNRQYGNIEDIKTDIESGILKINFISNEKLNKKELEDFYFMKKVGSAIKSFSEKLNLKYEVYLNGNRWNEIV